MAVDADSFGSAEEVMLQQEERLGELRSENKLLGSALEALEAKLRATQRREIEAESRADADASRAQRLAAQAADADARYRGELERQRHRAANDRILLEQAERGRREAEAQLSEARQQAAALKSDNAILQQRLAAAQRQLRKLEELQPFESCQQHGQGRSDATLRAELDRANSRVQQLEGRCSGLEAELAGTAAALAAAQALVTRRERQQDEQQQQQRLGSLDLSDLCDFEGATSQFVGSPQGSAQSGGADSGAASLPRQALQQRQAGQQLEQSQRGEQLKRRQGLRNPDRIGDVEQREQQRRDQQLAAHEDEHTSQLSLVESLQQQLLEQQRQLAHLQLQQQGARSSAHVGNHCGDSDEAVSGGDAAVQLQRLKREVDKLRRRNMQLQTALAESSLQHARASAAAQREVQEAQQAAAVLRHQRDEAQQELQVLQAAAAVMGCDEAGGGADGSGMASGEQMEQLLEYATRCNAAVEQNAALLQEKKAWLDKLRAVEAEVERCRAEAAQLRLQHLQLLPVASGGDARPTTQLAAQQAQQAQQQGAQHGQGQGELVQALLGAQAAEAALRSVLGEAREELVAAAKALSSELRRVHALERLRISDMAEVQRLQRLVHELQKQCRQLYQAVMARQGQRAGVPGKLLGLPEGMRDAAAAIGRIS